MSQLDVNQEQDSEMQPEILPENTGDISGDTSAPVEAQPAPEPAYSAENDELSSFLEESTETQEQVRQRERAESLAQAAAGNMMSQEEASEWAVKGILSLQHFASEQTGKQLQLSQTQVMMSSVLFVPAIMKYGPMIQSYMEDMASGVDENSNMPEYMAGAGVAVVGGMLWWQSKKAPPKPKPSKEKGAKDGNKS